jgi:hypothetical protein
MEKREQGTWQIVLCPVNFGESNYLQIDAPVDASIVDPSNEVRLNDDFEGDVSHSVHGLHNSVESTISTTN